MILPLAAWARSGGGQHYSGGSGGSSGDGGGDGIAGLVFFLLRLVIDYPAVGVPVVTGIGIYLLVRHLRNPDRTTRRALEAMAAENAHVSLAGVAALRHRDPQFNLDNLGVRLRAVVPRVNAAWCAGSMSPVRRHISDAVYLRLRTQIALLRRQGLKNRVANLDIEGFTPVGVECDGDWDTIHFKLSARARDLDLPLDMPDIEVQKRLASAPHERFFEIWSFARQATATTSGERRGALEGRCANCGADLPAGDTVRCDYCKVLCNAGTHDWVLAEITQIVEWEATSTGNHHIPGFSALKSRDPGFNRARVEDQTSLLFWKWIDARSTGEKKRLARYAAAAVKDLGVTEGAPQGIDRAAVGGVDLVACDAVNDGHFERCYVRVKWSAAGSRTSEPQPWVSVLVLARKVGVVTGPGRAALVCRECYGPLDESDDIKCRYCGGAIGPGEQEWALEAITTPQAAERIRADHAASSGVEVAWEEAIDLPDLTDPREREALLGLMARILTADGVVAPAERRLLKRCARRWNVSKERVERWLSAGAGDTLDGGVLPALKPEDRLSFLRGLVIAALVDGRIDVKERQLLDAVCKALALPPETVDALIRQRQQARPGNVDKGPPDPRQEQAA